MLTPFEFGVKAASNINELTIAGLLGGGIGGGLAGYHATNPDKYKGKTDRRGRPVKAPSRALATLLGALGGGAFGGVMGRRVGRVFDAFRPETTPPALTTPMDPATALKPQPYVSPEMKAKMDSAKMNWEEHKAIARAQRAAIEQMTPAEKSQRFLEQLNNKKSR
jgi:hypothetical protein